jgi:preprotein translocase subunit YajC
MTATLAILLIGAPQEGGANPIGLLLPWILVFGIFYFIWFRPQQRERAKHDELLKNLKKGDEVVTVGGVYGRIMSLDAEKVSLRVAENVKIDVERSKVVRVVTPHVGEVESK